MILVQIKSFFKAEKGATMIEYALVVGLVAIVCITSVTTFGNDLRLAFDNLYTTLAATTPKFTPGT